MYWLWCFIMVDLKLRTECDFQVGPQQHQAFIRSAKQWHHWSLICLLGLALAAPLVQFAFRGAFLTGRTALCPMTDSTGPLIMQQACATSSLHLGRCALTTGVHSELLCASKNPALQEGPWGRSETGKWVWEDDASDSKSDEVPTEKYLLRSHLIRPDTWKAGCSQFIKTWLPQRRN